MAFSRITRANFNAESIIHPAFPSFTGVGVRARRRSDRALRGGARRKAAPGPLRGGRRGPIARATAQIERRRLVGLRRLEPAIDAAFKLTVEGNGFMVGEGQDLSHENAGNALLWIEPVIGVVNTGPGDAAGAAAVGPRLRAYHVAEPPFANHAREEVDVVRGLWHRRL